jgi:hypothetical protein
MDGAKMSLGESTSYVILFMRRRQSLTGGLPCSTAWLKWLEESEHFWSPPIRAAFVGPTRGQSGNWVWISWKGVGMSETPGWRGWY